MSLVINSTTFLFHIARTRAPKTVQLLHQSGYAIPKSAWSELEKIELTNPPIFRFRNEAVAWQPSVGPNPQGFPPTN